MIRSMHPRHLDDLRRAGLNHEPSRRLASIPSGTPILVKVERLPRHYRDTMDHMVNGLIKLFLLQHMIPADNRFERKLSLALDRAVVRMEEAINASSKTGTCRCWPCWLRN